jgi:hypothetical protein
MHIRGMGTYLIKLVNMKSKNQYKIANNFRKNSRFKEMGSTLILALLVASILLSVGFGLSNIATKEIKLSSIGSESGAAFYAADAGIECALFWDIQRPYDKLAGSVGLSLPLGTFATSSDSISYHLIPSEWLSPNTKEIHCPDSTYDIATAGDPSSQGGPPPYHPSTQSWAIQFSSDASYSYATTTFIVPIDSWNFSWGDKSTPCAMVVVGKKTNKTTQAENTTILSYGRSSCDSNPRRVERGLQVSY